ncbi:MAG TPA: PaaI family thioesterase [Pseudonocardia sp.]|nr:PaaI family thioesterase [Pseudonocardia sp.]
MTSAEAALTVEQAQRILDASPFGPWWGFTVEAVGRGTAQVRLDRREEFLRPGGLLQGGCAMTLADVTGWIAILSLLGPDDAAVTQQLTTSFLGAARTDLFCESRVLRAGRRTVYGTASTTGTDGGLVAHHTLTYTRI